MMIGRLPSRSGGRSVDVAFGATPEGNWKAASQDRGRFRDQDDHYIYLYVGGMEFGMSKSDVSECLDAMQYRQRKKAAENPRPLPSWQAIKNHLGDLAEVMKDAKVGRRQF
jgi:hypothetical protein